MLAATLAACATPTSGIDTTGMPPAMVQTVRMAETGDKAAQFRLGMTFYVGLGVERDCKQARRLFRAAATDSGGNVCVYSPPVTQGGSGRVMPVDTGPKRAGMEDAARALALTEGCTIAPRDLVSALVG